MSRTHRGFLFTSAAAYTLLLTCVATRAASISYASIGPIAPGLTFSGISESSGSDALPLYGLPSGSPAGLTFNAMSFSSSSANGGADLTDGQLNYIVTASSNVSIPFITFGEGGSFSLAGVGGSSTQALAGAIVRVSVLEVNGAPVAPINLAPASASVAFNLASNPGVAQPWGLSATVNIAGQLGVGQQATKVSVVIDNALVTISQPGTTASIIKGDFDVTVAPEPMSAVLGLPALAALAFARRRGTRS